MSVPSFFYIVASKISKAGPFLFERDNCAIWFCCFPKIQLQGNPKSGNFFFTECARIHSLVPRTKIGHKLQHTHYSCDQFLLCLVIHAFKSLKSRREIGSFGILPIPACVRPGISFRALLSCKIFITVKMSASFLCQSLSLLHQHHRLLCYKFGQMEMSG